MFDYVIFIGRFQPFHVGHQHVIDKAFELSTNVVLGLGSANLTPSIKNPLSFKVRKEIFERHYSDRLQNLLTIPIFDEENDAIWINNTIAKIKTTVLTHTNPNKHTTLHGLKDLKIGIVGFEKDASSYYIKQLETKSGWKYISIRPAYKVDATFIRNHWYVNNHIHDLVTPNTKYTMLKLQVNTNLYTNVVRDYKIVYEYKDMWSNAPFTPIFTATDVIVHNVYRNMLLMVRRGGQYGRGLWALPGGYLESNLSLHDNALKELEEETGLILDKENSTIIEKRVYDQVGRSQNGRIISHVYKFNMKKSTLPRIKASDDAMDCKWISQSEYCNLQLEDVFEDHHIMIEQMVGWKLKDIIEMENY
jgi:bifunctional NMN adenylyltransferase/nudix hydrolase